MEAPCTRRYREHPEALDSYRAFVHGDYPQAARLLERLLAQRPRSAALLNDLGVCRYLAGDGPAARATLERAARLGGSGSAAAVNHLALFRPDRSQIPPHSLEERTYRPTEKPVDLTGQRVSVIMLEYNNPELTLASLRSLRAHPPGLPFEVVLIDNSEGPPALDYCKASGLHELRYRKNTENAGFAGGCNQGAAMAQGSLLHFVNNDTLFRRESVEPLARLLATDSAVGIAGSRLLYRDGSLQHAGIVFSHLGGHPEHRCRFDPADAPLANVPLQMQAVTGASLMIGRGLFLDLGGFDEGYRNGYEDLDLCLRVRRAGRKVVYLPRSVLDHLESMSRGRTLHETANLRRFREAWGASVRRDELEYLRPEDNLLLSYTDDPRRGRRRRQWLWLCARLIRKHPGVAARLPLACVESAKHYRFQKSAPQLLAYLLEQGEPAAAATLFRAFLLRQGFRTGVLRAMRRALLEHRG